MRFISLLLFCVMFFAFAACVQAQCPGGNCQLGQPAYQIVYPTPVRGFLFGREPRPTTSLPQPYPRYTPYPVAPVYAPPVYQGYHPNRYYRR